MIWQALTLLLGGGLLFLAERILWVRRFLQRLREVRKDVYHEVNQAYVDDLKASSVDGKLTDEEAAQALRMAVGRLKEVVGIAAVQRVLRLLGLPWSLPVFVDDFLAMNVEAEVREQKLLEAARLSLPALSPPKEEN